ncbi:MAG: type III pantothenate kinase [Acidobacteriota bacterium]|nr:type III pantothenate kinase [Acidobacteriota bacterium]
MLLALDVGNTNVTVGVFENGRLIDHRRLRTVRDQTSDEWGILLYNLFVLASLDIAQVRGVIVSSVVPPLNASLAEMSKCYFHAEPVFVSHETDTGLAVCIDHPQEVGADRLVNGVAAFSKYGGPCIVVDFGTAITFDAVSAQAEYLGGVISAGVGISVEALFNKTARLPYVDFQQPKNVIGKNTVASMQSGLYYGALGAIDGIIERMIAELGPETRVVATGGQAHLMAPNSRYLKNLDEYLTLEGLQIIWARLQRRD